MKTIITILLALLSFTCFAFSSCIDIEDVSFWVKLPVHSITFISFYALVLCLLCWPVSQLKKVRNLKLPLFELLLLTLYGLWCFADIKYDLTIQPVRTSTYADHIAVFLAYFFYIYRDLLAPFFTKIANSNFTLALTAASFCVGLFLFFRLYWIGVNCGQEYLQIYPVSRIIAIFVWGCIAWFAFSRSWRVLVASLPFTYLYFYLGRQVSFFTSGHYTIDYLHWKFFDPYFKSLFDRGGYLIWDSNEWLCVLIFASVFSLQMVAYVAIKYFLNRKKENCAFRSL